MLDKKRETDLAKPVADWMRTRGYKVYAEIPCPSRCVDFIGLRNSDILCIELKRSLTTKQPKRARHYTSPVLYQARSCQIITPNVYVAVATKPRTSSIDICKENGVGVLMIQSKDKVIEIITPHKRIEPWADLQKEVKARCIAIGPSDDAGKPQQAGEGPAQDCQQRINEYRKTHPSATWKEIYKNVPNHYTNVSSLYGAMRMARERKWRAEYKKEKKEVQKLLNELNTTKPEKLPDWNIRAQTLLVFIAMRNPDFVSMPIDDAR